MGSYKELVELKEKESTKNREEVFGAIVALTQGHYENKLPVTYYHDLHYNQTLEGVTSKEILQYLNKKNKPIKDSEIARINRQYENGEIYDKEKDIRIGEIKENHSFNIRTIQRVLRFFMQKEMIYRKGNRYFMTDNCIYSTRHRSHFFSFHLLSSIMKLHESSLNTLEKNIDDLITFFGSYILICLLESGRPLDDEYVLSKNSKPLTLDEKAMFTEKWLREAVDMQELYKYFLETFLNQPDDKKVKDLTRVKFKEKRKEGNHIKYIYVDSKGKEYDHLNLVDNGYRYIDKSGKEVSPPSLFDEKRIAVPVRITPILRFTNSFPFPDEPYNLTYELNNEIYGRIRNIISTNYPEIYQRFLDGPDSFHGAKNEHAWDIYHEIKKKKSNNTMS